MPRGGRGMPAKGRGPWVRTLVFCPKMSAPGVAFSNSTGGRRGYLLILQLGSEAIAASVTLLLPSQSICSLVRHAQSLLSIHNAYACCAR